MNRRAQPWYATNARDLLATREQGLMPAGPVVVSLVGGGFADVAAATLYARPDMPVERMDWRMLVNLQVWLWAGPGAALGWLLATASRIAHARPEQLLLRFEEPAGIHDVEIGTGLHIPKVLDLPAQHQFEWVPINCSGTAVGAKLRAALLDTHPSWTRL